MINFQIDRDLLIMGGVGVFLAGLVGLALYAATINGWWAEPLFWGLIASGLLGSLLGDRRR